MNYFKVFRPLSPIRKMRPYIDEKQVVLANSLEKPVQKEKSERTLPSNQKMKTLSYSKMEDLIKTVD